MEGLHCTYTSIYRYVYAYRRFAPFSSSEESGSYETKKGSKNKWGHLGKNREGDLREQGLGGRGPLRFGADVLVPMFWRRRFGAKTFWRRTVLAPIQFWRPDSYAHDFLAPGRFGVKHIIR